MAFGGVPTATVPSPVGIILIDDKMPQYDAGGVHPSARNSVIYESFVLDAWSDSPIFPNNADVGVLNTGAPGGNDHGLPINFGPGRGKWMLRDARMMKFPCEAQRNGGPIELL